MKIGDKVIYIFDPYTNKKYPLDSIVYATVIGPPRVILDENPAIKPIKNLIGDTGMHGQIANSNYLYKLGDHKVVKMIFERGIE